MAWKGRLERKRVSQKTEPARCFHTKYLLKNTRSGRICSCGTASPCHSSKGFHPPACSENCRHAVSISVLSSQASNWTGLSSVESSRCQNSMPYFFFQIDGILDNITESTEKCKPHVYYTTKNNSLRLETFVIRKSHPFPEFSLLL